MGLGVWAYDANNNFVWSSATCNCDCNPVAQFVHKYAPRAGFHSRGHLLKLTDILAHSLLRSLDTMAFGSIRRLGCNRATIYGWHGVVGARKRNNRAPTATPQRISVRTRLSHSLRGRTICKFYFNNKRPKRRVGDKNVGLGHRHHRAAEAHRHGKLMVSSKGNGQRCRVRRFGAPRAELSPHVGNRRVQVSHETSQTRPS